VDVKVWQVWADVDLWAAVPQYRSREHKLEFLVVILSARFQV
jgi:hypothetical protein